MQAPDRAYRFAATEVHLGDTPLSPGFLEDGLGVTKGVEKGTAMVGEELSAQLQNALDWGRVQLNGHR
jgi:hypothetical protein